MCYTKYSIIEICYIKNITLINNLPDIPGVQWDSPGFPFPKAIEVERPAVVEGSTAGPNLASSYLVPQRA